MQNKDTYKETIASWDNVAELYEKSFMNLKLYNDSYDRFSELIGNSPTLVLEIGCGPGNITKYLLEMNQEMSIMATDVSSNMLKLAQRNNPTADCKQLDARDISTIGQKFDGVIAGFVLPYLLEKDCDLFLQNCIELLEKQGVLYLSFVSGKKSKSSFIQGSTGDQMFFSYYTSDYIKSRLKMCGMDITEELKVPYIDMGTIKAIHTIIIARKTKS